MVLKHKQNPNIHQEKPKTNPITMPHFYIYLENVQLQPIKTDQSNSTIKTKASVSAFIHFCTLHLQKHQSFTYGVQVKWQPSYIPSHTFYSRSSIIDINYGF
jgi:hypothetical protein